MNDDLIEALLSLDPAAPRPAPSDAAIAAYERAVGTPFTDEYRQLLREVNGWRSAWWETKGWTDTQAFQSAKWRKSVELVSPPNGNDLVGMYGLATGVPEMNLPPPDALDPV